MTEPNEQAPGHDDGDGGEWLKGAAARQSALAHVSKVALVLAALALVALTVAIVLLIV
jgi:hypothetical protein